MKLVNTISTLLSSATLVLSLASCGVSILGGGGEGGGGGGGGGEDPSVCAGPSPAGCKVQGCPAGQTCSDEGCASSSCSCDPTTGTWACTDDCGGGVCVPGGSACLGPNPAGCKTQGCPAGEMCVMEGCTSSGCACDATTGLWTCDSDCGGGICKPAGGACSDPNPAGCKSQGCPSGQTCVEEGCTSSTCSCDPATNQWICTDDCGGGICKPNVVCPGPNPVGCKVQGCPAGQICADEGCTPSGCGCDATTGQWICTADCGGGTCKPGP